MKKITEKLRFPVCDSMAQAAESTGIPLSILKTAKRNGCPAFQYGRVDLGDFLRWFFAQDTEHDVDWTKRDKRASALTKEAKLEETRDHLCDVSIVTQFIHDLVANCFFGELERQAHEYPSTLKGKNEVAIHEECIKQMESAKKTLRLRLEAWDRGEMRKQ